MIFHQGTCTLLLRPTAASRCKQPQYYDIVTTTMIPSLVLPLFYGKRNKKSDYSKTRITMVRPWLKHRFQKYHIHITVCLYLLVYSCFQLYLFIVTTILWIIHHDYPSTERLTFAARNVTKLLHNLFVCRIAPRLGVDPLRHCRISAVVGHVAQFDFRIRRVIGEMLDAVVWMSMWPLLTPLLAQNSRYSAVYAADVVLTPVGTQAFYAARLPFNYFWQTTNIMLCLVFALVTFLTSKPYATSLSEFMLSLTTFLLKS